MLALHVAGRDRHIAKMSLQVTGRDSAGEGREAGPGLDNSFVVVLRESSQREGSLGEVKDPLGQQAAETGLAGLSFPKEATRWQSASRQAVFSSLLGKNFGSSQ